MASKIIDITKPQNPWDKDGVLFRREIPEGSGALACVGMDYSSMIEILSNVIVEAAPEIKKRETAWIIRARPNGIWIEFYEDEAALKRRVDQQAEIREGLQIHAGRLTWW